MVKSKAAFRAIRETVGMTQAALAAELGVQVRSVKRWEDQDAPQWPPEDAWDVLMGALGDQRTAVDFAVDRAMDLRDETGAGAVRLRYWADAADYAEHGTDSFNGIAGDWRMANANARAAAAALCEHGFEVDYADGAAADWRGDFADREPSD